MSLNEDFRDVMNRYYANPRAGNVDECLRNLLLIRDEDVAKPLSQPNAIMRYESLGKRDDIYAIIDGIKDEAARKELARGIIVEAFTRETISARIQYWAIDIDPTFRDRVVAARDAGRDFSKLNIG